MSCNINNVEFLIFKIIAVTLTFDIILNTKLRRWFYSYDNNIAYIFGNIFVIKFILLMLSISFILDVHMDKTNKNTTDYSSTIFSKAALISSGIIFFQILFLFIFNYVKKTYYNTMDENIMFLYDLINIIINIIISQIFLYVFFETELKDNLINEIIPPGIVAAISLFIIVFSLFIIISINPIKALILSKFAFIKYFYFWNEDFTDWITDEMLDKKNEELTQVNNPQVNNPQDKENKQNSQQPSVGKSIYNSALWRWVKYLD